MSEVDLDAFCDTPMAHPDKSVGHCTLPKGHQVLVEDSDH